LLPFKELCVDVSSPFPIINQIIHNINSYLSINDYVVLVSFVSVWVYLLIRGKFLIRYSFCQIFKISLDEVWVISDQVLVLLQEVNDFINIMLSPLKLIWLENSFQLFIHKSPQNSRWKIVFKLGLFQVAYHACKLIGFFFFCLLFHKIWNFLFLTFTFITLFIKVIRRIFVWTQVNTLSRQSIRLFPIFQLTFCSFIFSFGFENCKRDSAHVFLDLLDVNVLAVSHFVYC